MKDWPRHILKSVFLAAIENDPAPRKHHITRLASYKFMGEAFSDRPRSFDRAISISGSRGLIAALGLEVEAVDEANFPAHSCTDLSSFENGLYDLYVSDQVLEHVEGHPKDVFSECFRLLRTGGVGIISTCLINPVHGHPSDYWRFTEEGLKFLAKDAGFTIITSGGWGNRLVWPYINLGLRMVPIPENPDNPVYQIALENEPDVPVTTWVVFEKP